MIKTGGNKDTSIDPRAPDEVKALKKWMCEQDIKELKDENQCMPNKVAENLEILLLHHLSRSDNFDLFVAGHEAMSRLVRVGSALTKADLYDIIRKHHQFFGTKVVVFMYGEDDHPLVGANGHWFVVVVDFARDTVFVYDSTNQFNGVSATFEKLKKIFIVPHLCYLQENDRPLDNPERGKVTEIQAVVERVNNFKLNTSVRMPKTQQDDFSCGLWATKILLQVVMEQKCLENIQVGLISKTLQQHRQFLVRLMETRYLYVDGMFKDPIAIEEEKVPSKKREQKTQDKFDDNKSCLTHKTNKTASGALKRHCEPCDKLVSNWSQHKQDAHRGADVPFYRCGPFCPKCTAGNNQPSTVEQGTKSSHQGHKMGRCFECDKESEARRLVEGLCTTCSKTQAKTVINVPTSGFLTAGVLNRLPQQQELAPGDSLSMIGDKRRRELMEDELRNFPQDLSESEESKHEHPQKRQETTRVQSFDTVPLQTTIVGHVIVVSYTDAGAIEKLKEIERSLLPQSALSLELQSVCMMFPQESVVNFLRDGNHPVIVSLLPSVLARAGQLSTQQHAGLLFACIVFDGQCWNNATAMLDAIEYDEREKSLDLFKLFAVKIYGKDTAAWLFNNWKCVESWQFKLIEYLRGHSVENSYKILQMALILSATDIAIFVNYAAEFTKTPCSSLVIDYLQAGGKHSKFQFEDFMTLADALMLEKNAFVIQNCKEELMRTPLTDWTELIEKTASTVHLSDKGSVQEAINEFIQVYGPIEKTFSNDLFLPGSPLGLLLRETSNKSNFKQLGLSHYCIGGLRKVEKQLWCVPSGDGKSRIFAFSCLIGLKTGMFQMVYLVFDNEHLMERDRADFEDLWRLAGCQDKVEYHVGYDFKPAENSLILVDESDRVMFEQPKAFGDFVDKKFCICFTATPSNCDQQGVEAEVIKALGFKQYEYVIGQHPVNAATRMQFDEVSQASTLEEKVETVRSLLKQGSVLVYGPQDLYEKLHASFGGVVLIDKAIDPLMLRQLDKAPYRLLVSITSFGMRGIDYRSKLNPLCLVVAQQFPCMREALQGVARVGRFGDPCRKIKFADCQQLVDQRTQADYNAQLLSYIELVKTKVKVEVAQTKKSSPKKPQLTQGSRLPLSRARALLAQPPAGQASLTGFFRPSTALPGNTLKLQLQAALLPQGEP